MTCRFGIFQCPLRLLIGGVLLGMAVFSGLSDVGVWVLGAVGVLSIMDTLE